MSMMFSKVAILLFAGCAVALALPHDTIKLRVVKNQQPEQEPSDQLQVLNQNQIQEFIAAQLQKLSPEQLQALLTNQFQGSNSNQLVQEHTTNQLPTVRSGLDNGYNPEYKTPILELPNRVIDWGQKVVDNKVDRVGTAVGKAFKNTERVVNGAIDTIGEVGKRGFQGGAELVKSGLGIFTSIPKSGLDLFSSSNNNNNNEN